MLVPQQVEYNYIDRITRRNYIGIHFNEFKH